MPWTVTVDVTKVTNLFTKLASGVETDIPIKALTAGAVELQLSARAAAPIRTGNLRNSIQVGPASPTNIAVEAGADYALFVEAGTVYMSARPYMKPSIGQAVTALVDTATREIVKATKV